MGDIFQANKYIEKMETKQNVYTVEYIKRFAKTLKKQNNIPHHQALDCAAIKFGFNNWKHVLNAANKQITPKDNIVVESLTKARKNDPYRNLLVAAINKLIEGNYISLNLDQVDQDREYGHVFFKLFEHDSVVIWRNIGFGELTISVWWKYNHSKHPQAEKEGNAKERFNDSLPLANENHYRKFVGVTVSCWLERKNGQYIQGKNRECLIDIYTRKGELENLKSLPIQEPKGYGISGRFHM